MRLQFIARWGLIAVTAMGFLAVSACKTREPEPGAAQPKAVGSQSDPRLLKDEIPSSELAAVMAAHYEGLGHMERYEYKEAVEAFRSVRKRAPGWIPGSINLAIALLNDSGVKAEEAKKAGAGASAANFDEALELLAGVLEREPNNPYAHFCRGIMLEQLGNLAEAHRHFKRVTEIDPTDAAAWYWMAGTIPDTSNQVVAAKDRATAIREKSKQEIALLGKALELNPYLTPAVYKFYLASRFVMSREESMEWLSVSSGSTPISPTRCRRRGQGTRSGNLMARWAGMGMSSIRSRRWSGLKRARCLGRGSRRLKRSM